MRILLYLHKPFLPTIDGGNAASKALYEQLVKEGHDVELLLHSTNKHPFKPELFKDVKTCVLQTKLNLNLIKASSSLLKNESYHFSRYRTKENRKRIRSFFQKEQFDVIILDGLFSAAFLKEIKSIHSSPIWLRMHNVEHQIWREEAKNAKNSLKRKYLELLTKQLKEEEEAIFKLVDGILSISKEDESQLANNIKEKTLHFPYIPPVAKKLYNPSKADFFHFGAMNWAPNQGSLEILESKLFPRILKSLPKAKLQVAGSFLNASKKPKSPNTKYRGYVDDLSEFFTESGILLAPMQTGSGVRIKIIQALSHGVPVVTTTKGAEGIPLKNGEGICIAENEEEFIKYALQLAQSEEQRRMTSAKAINIYKDLGRNINLTAIFADNE
jgi:hypothetical protein